MKLTTENFFQYLLEHHEDIGRINVFPHKQETLVEHKGSDINISRYVLAEILNQPTSQYRSYVFDSMRWNGHGGVEKMLGIDVFYYQPSRVCYENYNGHDWVDTLSPFKVQEVNSRHDPMPNPFDLDNFIDHKRFCKRCGKDWADR